MSRPPITGANPYTPRRGALAGVTFTSERQYRNALARQKGYGSLSEQQRAAKPVHRARDLDRLRPAEREARGRALDAVRLMRRDGLPLEQASRATGTTPNAVRRHAGTALVKGRGGRYEAKPYDRLSRPMKFPTLDGLITLDVRDSRSASAISHYWNAVHDYRDRGNDRPLRKFRGKSVRVEGRAYPFITDTGALDMLMDAGELHFDSIYALAA